MLVIIHVQVLVSDTSTDCSKAVNLSSFDVFKGYTIITSERSMTKELMRVYK